MIGELAAQVKASKLTDYQLTKKLLEEGEVEKLQLQLDALKYGVNKDEDDDKNKGGGGVVEEVTMERLVQVHYRQELHNKK